MEKEKILETKQIHNSEKKPTIHKNIERPAILKSEVKSTLAKMKRNKALNYFRIFKIK